MVPLFGLLLVSYFSASKSVEVITRSQSMRDGETVLSARKTYEMGFFSPGSSKMRYLGIWFKKAQPEVVVWVANRENPLENSTGVLRMDEQGRLLLLDKEGGKVVWSTKGFLNTGVRVFAKLLDSGNLEVRDGEKDLPAGLLWQSIDEPSHVMLPGMKMSANRRTGARRHLTSWKSPDDPSPGNYTVEMDFSTLPRVLLKHDQAIKFSTGHFNGYRFVGVPFMQPESVLQCVVRITEDQADYIIQMKIPTISIMTLSYNGVGQRLLYDEGTNVWETFTYLPADECDRFANCGAFSICNMSNFPVCGCLEGYAPRNGDEWDQQNFSSGCVRRTRPDCSGGDGFLLMPLLKLPHLINSTVDIDISLSECRNKCTSDCSCTAYASANVTDGMGGCITWFGDLLDMRILEMNVQDLYIRVPASSLVNEVSMENKKPKVESIVLTATLLPALVAVLFFLFSVWMLKIKIKRSLDTKENTRIHETTGRNEELPVFSFEIVVSATFNFSDDNKVGEGAFGVVYKGIMPDGQEIAVKRLKISSLEGQRELTNEVKSLAKLRHRNLVRLLGCCIAGEEKMLIYEYMKNKSLDAFIFDETKRGILGWRTRLNIVHGIACGLHYLHDDSGSRIIHRDVKACNVLLDVAMIPKISDFGTARIFDGDQMLERSRKIVGTYGYIPPEYAIDGVISTKTDVFSFGVLLLEIISGVRNRGLYFSKSEESLLSKAWRLWEEGNCAELLDDAPTDLRPISELLRCIQVGLLCVQEQAVDRPSMDTVTMMLLSATFPLPQPKRPGFVIFGSWKHSDSASSVELQDEGGNGVTRSMRGDVD